MAMESVELEFIKEVLPEIVRIFFWGAIGMWGYCFLMLLFRWWLAIQFRTNTQMIVKVTRFLLRCRTDDLAVLRGKLWKSIQEMKKISTIFVLSMLSGPIVFSLFYLKALIFHKLAFQIFGKYMTICFSLIVIPSITAYFLFVHIYCKLFDYIQKLDKSRYLKESP